MRSKRSKNSIGRKPSLMTSLSKREKLAARQNGEEQKSVPKAQARVDELEVALQELSEARSSAEAYVKQLRYDIRQTLRLAKGFERIDGQVSQAIEKRDNPEQAAPPRSRSGPRRSRPKNSDQKASPAAQSA